MNPRTPPAPVLMVQGTSSGAGKSLLVTALCRIFHRRGLRVVPFKAQNMSNNAAVAEGGEMGRAQALQARAAGVEPRLVMNPVLVKPLADTRSEVVVLGRSAPEVAHLPWMDRRSTLWPVVRRSLADLRGGADLVIAEGAGSPAEINLRAGDIVNMAVARESGAAVLLVTDIDRGGAFASLYGTWALLPHQDRRHLKGFVLNRFRGDPDLLAPAPDTLDALTGVPTLGVVPWIDHLLPEEDAATLHDRGGVEPGGTVIAAVRLPHVSNMDDLDPLAAEPGVAVRWITHPGGLDGAAAVVVPGTRNTPGDLQWLGRTGLATAISSRARAGFPVLGVCGGYQMLGRALWDPDGVEAGVPGEGGTGATPGLSLLPVRTRYGPLKRTRLTTASTRTTPGGPPGGRSVRGYEIRQGDTVPDDGAAVWLAEGETPLGVRSGSVLGCAMHGLLENPEVRAWWLGTVTGHAPVDPGPASTWETRLEADLDHLADVVGSNLDPERILAIARAGAGGGSGW